MMDAEHTELVAAARELIEAATGAGPDAAPARERFVERWPAVVQLCSAHPEARASLRDLQDSLDGVAEDLEGADWVSLIIGVLHEEPFVAIEPATARGLIGRLSGIADNFQLHTLLMDELPEQRGWGRRAKRRVSESAAAIARGDGPQESDETITGAWNLYSYAAWRNGRLPDGDLEARGTWIWNEGTPADIPLLDGHRVILLGEPPYVRTWPAVRLFPELRASLGARELEAADVEAWLTRIAAATTSTRGPHA